ncbi:MAG: hypothetical protein V3T17_08910 [Pseudomonadales bacterium]
MAKLVHHNTPFTGTINTAPPLLVVGAVTVAPDKMSALTLEIALEADVDRSLATLFPAFPYISGAFTIPGVLTYKSITAIPLAKKTTKGKTAVVLEGTLKFAFTVITPAAIPPPVGSPDPNKSYEATVTLSPTQPKFTSV